jgi:PAS domain S-box-containing protein
MNSLIDEQSNSNLQSVIPNSSSSVWNRFMRENKESCFEIFSCLISKEKYPTMKHQLIMKSGIIFIRTLQVFSLLINFDVPMKLDENVAGFWTVICIFRIDVAFYLLDALLAWVAISITIPSITLLLIIILRIKTVKGQPIEKSKFLSLFEIIFNLGTSVLYIPILYTLLEQSINGFYSIPNPRIPNVPIILSIVCIITLLIHVILTSMRSLFYAHTDHSLYKKYLECRASGQTLLIYDYYVIIQVAFQIYLLPPKPTIFYITSIIGWIVLSWLFNKKQPYYSGNMNSIMISSCLASMVVAFTIVLSWLLDTPSVPFLLSIFFLPIFIVSSFIYTSSRYDIKLVNYQESLHYLHLAHEYELGIRRNLLYNKSEVQETFKYVRQDHKIKRNKMFYIWESYYCISMGMDGLARLILSKGLTSDSSLEADFYYYHSKKILSSIESTEGVKFLAFQEEIWHVKALDEEVCFILCDFWEELAQPKPIPKKIANLLFSSQKLIDKLKREYKHLLQKHTRSTHIMKLYGSFLAQVANRHDKGEQLILRAEEEKVIRARNRRLSEKYLSFFDDELGIMMISGAPDNEGTIVYANSRASEITGYSLQTLHGSNISTIIPPPFASTHASFMKSYLNDLPSDSLQHPSTMFFYVQSCKIIPVNVNLKVTALSGFPMFLLAFSVKKNYPDLAILNEDGVIDCHTANFAQFLGSRSSLVGTKIQEHVPLTSYTIVPFRPFKISATYSIYCMFAYAQFRTKKVDLFLVLKGEREYEKWVKSSQNIEKDSLLLNYDHKATYKNYKIFEEDEREENLTFDTADNPRILSEERRLSSIVTFGTMPEIHTYRQAGYSSLSAENEIDESQGLTKELQFKPIEASSKSTRSESRTITSSFFTTYGSNINTSSNSFLHTKSVKLNNIFLSLRLYKYLFLFTVLISITSFVVTGVVFYVIANHSVNQSVIDILSEKFYIITQLGQDARVLDLNARGFIVEPNIDVLLSDMTTAINRLHQIEKKLKDKYSNWRDSSFKRMYTENVVPIYEYEDGVPSMKKTNLFDMTQKIIASARIVVDRGTNNILNDTDAYFLYRNGLGEAASATNSSIIKFVEYQYEDIDIIGTESYICIGIVVLILIICVVIVLPKLQMIKRQTSELWRDIYKTNKAVLLECRSKLIDRLLIVHLLERETERLDKKHRAINADRLDIPYKPWRNLIKILAIFIIITFGFILILYFWVIDESTLLMRLRPELYEMTADEMVSIQGIWGWMKECNLYNTSASIKYSDPVFMHNVDPYQMLEITEQRLYKIKERMDEILDKSGISLDTSHFDLLYRKLDSEYPILRKGLNTGFNLYNMECHKVSKLPWSSDTQSWVQSYRLVDQEIRAYKKKSMQEYYDSFDKFIENRRNWSVVIVSIYSSFGILYYIIVFTRGLNKASMKIKRILKTALRVKAYEALNNT